MTSLNMKNKWNILSWKALDKLLWTWDNFKELKREEKRYRDIFAWKVTNTLEKKALKNNESI